MKQQSLSLSLTSLSLAKGSALFEKNDCDFREFQQDSTFVGFLFWNKYFSVIENGLYYCKKRCFPAKKKSLQMFENLELSVVPIDTPTKLFIIE